MRLKKKSILLPTATGSASGGRPEAAADLIRPERNTASESGTSFHAAPKRGRGTTAAHRGSSSSGTSTSTGSHRGTSPWGAPQGTSRRTKRAHQPSPSTSHQAYSTAAASPRNYLIHVYRERDDLVPFECEAKFCAFRDTVRAAIWARYAQHGSEPDLVIMNWSYRRSSDRSDAGLGIIYCFSEERQMTVMELIVSIGLGGHILESGDALQDGM
jgi:hypothetical protein